MRMQIAQEDATASAALGVALPESSTGGRSSYSEYKLIRRNGAVVGFEPAKITVAMTKAFLAVNGSQGAASARIRELVVALTAAVIGALMRRQPQGGTFHIEDVQDQVELALMRSGEHDVARAYVLYREERAKLRAQEKAARTNDARVHVVENGQRRPTDGRSAQVGGARRARPDREGSGLQLCHGAAAAQHHPARGPRRGSEPGGHGDALRRLLPAMHRAWHRRRAAGARASSL